jgi:uncharacterized protein YndB with AHSA1/START domain
MKEQSRINSTPARSVTDSTPTPSVTNSASARSVTDSTPTPSVIHSTFVIERSYPKPPERVFAAFADPAQKRRWFAEGESHDLEEFELDFRVGGIERARFRFKEHTPLKGRVLLSEGSYLDIVPNRRIVNVSTMSFGDKPMSASLVTFELLPTENGTDLILTHQGAFLEGADGPEMREAGWRKLLEQLAKELAR